VLTGPVAMPGKAPLGGWCLLRVGGLVLTRDAK
jgi:hypothetical protein